MARKSHCKADPIERALDPGGFIRDRACFGLVAGLDLVHGERHRKTGFMAGFEEIVAG
jgi:hypothetical protein